MMELLTIIPKKPKDLELKGFAAVLYKHAKSLEMLKCIFEYTGCKFIGNYAIRISKENSLAMFKWRIDNYDYGFANTRTYITGGSLCNYVGRLNYEDANFSDVAASCQNPEDRKIFIECIKKFSENSNVPLQRIYK